MCILKTLTNLCFTKQKLKTQNAFVKVVYSVLVVKTCWQNIKKFGKKKSVRLEKGTIEFKNYFKQIPVSFEIYADFECNLKSVENY